MESFFLSVLNMSLTGTYVILAVLLVRLLLKKAPKKYSYWLWSVPAFRLVCPVSFSSMFSLFSLKAFTMPAQTAAAGSTLTYIPDNIGYELTPQVNVGIPALSDAVNSTLPEATPMWSVNPIQVWIFIGTVLWCMGMAVMFLWAVVSCVRLVLRLRKATLLEKGVYECETVRSPFILGFFAPRIYLPYNLTAEQLRYVLAHERNHIRRGDHIVKIFAYGVLTLHWFNPLCWLAYHLMNKDMEMRCDEYVLSQPDMRRKDYSMSLLSIASSRRFPCPSPLAFAESGVKQRIKNVLNWKKPKVWVRVVAVAVCIVCMIGCGLNPAVQKPSSEPTQDNPSETGPDTEISAPKKYVTDQQVYLTPLSSFRGVDDNGLRYLINEDSITVIDRNTDAQVLFTAFSREWEEFPYDEEMWNQVAMWSQEYDYCSVDFLAEKDATRYRYVDASTFLLKLDEILYVCSCGMENEELADVWSIHSLKEEASGMDAFGVADPVVEFGMDRMNSLSLGLSNIGIHVNSGEILGFRQIPTATVNENHSINLYAVDFRFSADVPENAVGEDGIVSFSAWGSTVYDWQEYPQNLRYEDGWLVPETQVYLLMEHNLENGIWTPLWSTTEAEIQYRFATEEMLNTYGNVYTAAAMELYNACVNSMDE